MWRGAGRNIGQDHVEEHRRSLKSHWVRRGQVHKTVSASTRQPDHFTQKEPNSLKDLQQIAKLETRVSPQLEPTTFSSTKLYNEDSFKNAIFYTIL